MRPIVLTQISSFPYLSQAYVEREHEFRFVAVATENLDGNSNHGLAVSQALLILLQISRYHYAQI